MKSRYRQVRHWKSGLGEHRQSRIDRRQRQRPPLGRTEEEKFSHLQHQPIPLKPRIDRRELERQQQQTQPTSARLRQQQRIRERRRIQMWETGIAMSFTVVWAAIALAGLAKLRPVLQETHQNLATLSSEVEQLQTRVNRAWRKVELGLDSTQSDTAIRESLNYVPFNQLGVVFEEPATPRE